MSNPTGDSHQPVQTDGGLVRWRGRVQKGVDGASFELLSQSHARDKSTVYFAMETKLKPIKHADPATFVSLGRSYGRDAERAYFESKTLRLKKGAGGTLSRLRELSRYYATDGAWLYFGTAHCDLPEGEFNWDSADYRPFWENGINQADAVLTDGRAYFYRGWADGWVGMEPVDVENLRLLDGDLPGTGPGRYFTDGRTVIYRGRAVEGAAPESAKAIGRDVLEDGRTVFAGATPIPFQPGELRCSRSDIYRSSDGVYRVEPNVPPKELATRGDWDPPTVEVASIRIQELLLPRVSCAFDRHLPVETAPADLDLDALPTASSPKPTAPAEPDRWFAHLCEAWAKDRGRSDRLVGFINYGTGYPDADALPTRLMREVPGAFVDLIAALEAAGDKERARLVAHGLQSRAGVELEPSELVKLPLSVVPESGYQERKWALTVTTNLGVAKHVVTGGLIEDPDPRVRWEAANLLCGVLRASDKTESIFRVVLEPILDRCAKETGVLRDIWLLVLESAGVAATVHAELGRGFLYAELERIAVTLIRAGVNVAISQVRLVEALWGQGRKEEADAVTIDCAGPLPGPFMYRERCPDARAARERAKARAEQARSPRDGGKG